MKGAIDHSEDTEFLLEEHFWGSWHLFDFVYFVLGFVGFLNTCPTVKCMRGLKSVVGGIKADNKIRGYKADN